MIALQVLLVACATIGLWAAFGEFRRAQDSYQASRAPDSGTDGFGLLVAAHMVRVAVFNVAILAILACSSLLILTIMLTGWMIADLVLVMMTGLASVALLFMMKELNYRYERGLMIDAALVTDRPLPKASHPLKGAAL